MVITIIGDISIIIACFPEWLWVRVWTSIVLCVCVYMSKSVHVHLFNRKQVHNKCFVLICSNAFP